MNDLKLLAVDGSLDSQKPAFGRFRMNDPKQLPEFNPVTGESEESKTDPADGAVSRSSGRSMWRRFFGWVRSSSAEVSLEPAEAGRQRELSESVVASSSPPDSATEEPATESQTRRGWFRSGNPFKREPSEPVQAEFRFENVRAVCNDLHDTDFIIKT